MRIAVVLVLALLLVPPAVATPVSSPNSAKAVFLAQARLFRHGRLRALYETTYTRNYRAHCSWRVFKQGQSAFRRYLGPGYVIRHLRARKLSARRALLTYQFLHRNGTNALTVTYRQHDVYVKIGNRWYDDYNGDGHGC